MLPSKYWQPSIRERHGVSRNELKIISSLFGYPNNCNASFSSRRHDRAVNVQPVLLSATSKRVTITKTEVTASRRRQPRALKSASCRVTGSRCLSPSSFLAQAHAALVGNSPFAAMLFAACFSGAVSTPACPVTACPYLGCRPINVPARRPLLLPQPRIAPLPIHSHPHASAGGPSPKESHALLSAPLRLSLLQRTEFRARRLPLHLRCILLSATSRATFKIDT